MDYTTFLAYLAIGIAVLAYPIELLWKKLFSVKAEYYLEMLHNFFNYSRYVLGLIALLIAAVSMDFTKQFVFVVAASIGLLVISIVTDLVYSLRRVLESEHLKVTQRQHLIEERLDTIQDKVNY